MTVIIIPMWLLMAFFYHSFDPNQWTQFSQGFFTAMNIWGIFDGLKIILKLFSKPRIKNKHLR
jgi:hypothetical protein